MEKGIIYDQNVLNHISRDEMWLPIPQSLIPFVKPYYYISTKGRVWSTVINGQMSLAKATNGYLTVMLSRENMESIRVLVHRIEMLLFKWIPGCEQLEVNHIDGDKENLDLYNLEWVTSSENKLHAYANNLRKKGERHPMSTHTESQVRKICEGLEQKLPLRTCAVLAGMESNDTNEKFVSDIKHGVIWTDISSQYNIPKERNNQLFSDNEIHQICKLMEQGLTNKEIVDIVRPDLEESKYKNVMNSIRRRARFTRISNNYNF